MTVSEDITMIVKTYPSQNTRRFKRLRGNFLVKYQIAMLGGESVVANVRDVSGGGIKFWTKEFVPEGALLRLSLLIPAMDHPLEMLGRVLRVSRPRHAGMVYLAVEFLEMSRADQAALDDLIESLSKTREARFFMDDRPVVKRSACTSSV